MRINKGTYLMIALLLTCATGMAQSISSFTISPIVISSSSTSSIGGNPILLEGGSKCLTVATGLRTMMTSSNGTGKFGESCTEVPPVGQLSNITSLTVFPNPTHSLATLKVEGQFDVNLSCQVRIVSMDGRTMMSQMVSMKDVQVGYVLNASAYAAGTYVISVDFMNKHYTLKLIKI
jgi:hypothetical protein